MMAICIDNVNRHTVVEYNAQQVIRAKLMRHATALAVPLHKLSWCISSHFVAIYPESVHRNRKSPKNTKLAILGVQGHLRSSILILLKSSSLVLVMISRMFVSICNCFHARRANISKIITFMRAPLFDVRMRRPP